MPELEIFNCEQGTPEWYEARLGIPTASEFATVMAKGEGKTRRTYLLKLAGEKITGQPAENYSNADMQRGKDMEAEARERYAFERELSLEQVGFVRCGRMGCSPDSFVGDDGGFEAKTCAPHVHLDHLLRGTFPAAHRAQVQGTLMVTGRDWWDIGIYWPRLPLFIVRATPDRDYIANLRGEIDRFNDELDDIVEKVRRYGVEEALAA